MVFYIFFKIQKFFSYKLFPIHIKGAVTIRFPPKKKADVLYRKVLSIRLLYCIIKLLEKTHKKAR